MFTSKLKNDSRFYFFNKKNSHLNFNLKSTQILGIQEASNQNFKNQYENYHQEIRYQVQIFLKDLEFAGKKLLENINFENLKQYKHHLKKILDYILKYNYHIRIISGRRFDYKILHTINIKLHDLSFWILKKEKEKIYFVNQINEIKGLIVDILN